MNCTRCGRALDAQALELGACRYCGQPIPTGSAPAWNEAGSSNAPTEFGPPSFAVPDPFATSAAPAAGTAAFEASAPANAPQPSRPPQNAYPPFAAAPAQYPPAPAQYPPATPTRQRRGKPLALAIVVVVLLVALIGGGLLFARAFSKTTASVPGPSSPNATQPAPGPSATPTLAPIPTSAYRDPDGLFSVQYPTTWTHAAFSPGGAALPLSGVRFSSGKAEFVILSGQAPPGLPGAGLAEQTDDALLGAMNARNVSSASPVTIGGQSWTEKSADTGDGAHIVIASISFNGHLYSLWYSAPPGEFSADETQVFNPMVASFRFGA